MPTTGDPLRRGLGGLDRLPGFCAGRRQGYAYRFPAAIKDGRLVGNHLAEGTPGSLKVEGPIHADGRALLKGSGLTGSAACNIKQAAAGTPYEYAISARFAQAGGSGSRIAVKRR